jgi:hypothetical protein
VNTFVDDIQIVTDVELVLFSTVQQGAVNALVNLQNMGTNTITYVFQEFDGISWNDMGSVGTPTNGTLIANQVLSFQLLSSYAQVRMQGYASGGSTLGFAFSRFFNRVSGGPIPLLTY